MLFEKQVHKTRRAIVHRVSKTHTLSASWSIRGGQASKSVIPLVPPRYRTVLAASPQHERHDDRGRPMGVEREMGQRSGEGKKERDARTLFLTRRASMWSLMTLVRLFSAFALWMYSINTHL